jgi:hypothetical protein
MRYMLLIYTEETEPAEAMTAEGQEAAMQPWFEYSADMEAAGVLEAGEPLHPTSTATTVRVRNDETVTTDGPFAETKEVLGGYYVIDAPDLDDALTWAARCPAAAYGSVEVRPILPMPAVG